MYHKSQSMPNSPQFPTNTQPLTPPFPISPSPLSSPPLPRRTRRSMPSSVPSHRRSQSVPRYTEFQNVPRTQALAPLTAVVQHRPFTLKYTDSTLQKEDHYSLEDYITGSPVQVNKNAKSAPPVYYIPYPRDMKNRVKLRTLYPYVSLYDSYKQFQTGDMSLPGFRNYSSYLQQIQVQLAAIQCVHFIITDGIWYGFQKQVFVHSNHIGVSSQGHWVNHTDTNRIFQGIDWVVEQRNRFVAAHHVMPMNTPTKNPPNKKSF